jgi:hypothetical protein
MLFIDVVDSHKKTGDHLTSIVQTVPEGEWEAAPAA